MIRYRHIVFSLVFGMLIVPGLLGAQEEGEEEVMDDLGNVTDAFQEYFFEALKQKGIENYDKALQALEKAQKESPGEAAVYFEMAKNHGHLEQWDKAEDNYKKVLDMEAEKPEAYEGLYDVYYNTQNYEAAIEVVQKLIPGDDDYKEDLANLYERTEQYDKALKILDELDQDYGVNDYRNQLRQQIYSKSDNTEVQIADLEKRIKRIPNTEQDFLNLIFLYSEEGNEQAAFKTAKALLKEKPESELVHLALYKFYLQEKDTEAALQSMQIVFDAESIDQENKFKVLNDFLIFVNQNPEYEENLEQMVAVFSEISGNDKVFTELGNYYLKKEHYQEALLYFELGLEQNPEDFLLLKNTLLLQVDFKKYEAAAHLSENALDLFPSQPIFYLLQGVAYLNLNHTDKAKKALQNGLDFILDDPKMERDFYVQLQQVYEKEGNEEKANEFAQKAQKITPDNE